MAWVRLPMATIGHLRRVAVFGTNLVRLDIRQESDRHAQVLGELCDYLELGQYESWTEDQKVDFLDARIVEQVAVNPLPLGNLQRNLPKS